jgi:hypothetical protein
MASVRSAHCTGWYVSHFDKKPDGRPVEGRRRLEWWYQAPDKYRRETSTEMREWTLPPSRLIINGRRALIQQLQQPPQSWLVNIRQISRQELSPFDFFSREGILRRARREKGAQVSTREETRDGRTVRAIRIEYQVPIPADPWRHVWTLHVDPRTERLVGSEYTSYRKRDGAWKPDVSETLTQFRYNMPLPERLFRVERPRE